MLLKRLRFNVSVIAVMHQLLLRLCSGICLVNFCLLFCSLHNFVLQFTTASLVVGSSNL
jgi:hypothetical protein